MIGKIRAFLNKNQPIEKEIKESELKDWIEEELEKRVNEFEDETYKIDEEVGAIKKSINDKLDNLENANLKNTRITVKEKQYMEGNRQSFTKNLKNFLYNLPYNSDSDFFLQSQENFFGALDSLNKNNQKPVSILKHFFANEVRDIGNDIKSIENNYKQAKKIYKSKKIETLKKCLDEVNEYFDETSKLNEQKKKIFEKNKEVSQMEKEIKKIEDEKQRLEQDTGYKKFQELIENKKNINERIEKNKERIQDELSQIIPAVKKFSRNSLDDELGESLLSSVSHTLYHFDTKRVLKFLESLQKNLEKGNIELKDKKREKVQRAIKGIDEDLIDTYKEKLSSLKKERRKIENKIQNNQLLTDYSEIKYRLEHLKKKLENKKSEVKQAEEKKYELRTKKPPEIVKELDEELQDIKLTLCDEKDKD